ncbi:DotI/IcmL family type IV secretion protein [Legionella fallonii]|uniref:IcmL-like protein n=1 Tax=Legionella fallonii LLAP-10 TaxID=1212491 RepID=A0A098G564_9GAMM|nr:DotI/IcmL family type IV secretion protein [Legionella fallonii]CEG57612.1 conserved exported protein of unknown function [Legionella fallonii LLAP-10]
MRKKIFCGVLLNVLCIHSATAQAADIASSALNILRDSQKTNVINCDYRISAEIDKMEHDVVINWAKYAVIESFNFNPSSIDMQMSRLRSCYTNKGWNAFINAQQESGNLKELKTHSLYMSSQLDGRPELIEASETQWKLVVPIKVIYKNDQETAVHFLSIYLTIGWRSAFNLGITQMIAIPRLAPVSYQVSLVKEGIQSVYSGILNKKTGGVEGVKRSVVPFVVSLFTKSIRIPSSESYSIPNSASSLAKMYQINTKRQVPPLEGRQPYPEYQNKQTGPNQIAYRVLNHQQQLAETATLDSLFSTNKIKKNSPDLFDFKSDILAEQLQKVVPYSMDQCLNTLAVALDKIKNAKVIQTKELTLKSQKNSEPRLVETQNNQWDMTLPVQIVYQSEGDNITKPLNVHLVIERKAGGGLEITQMKTTPSDVFLSEHRTKLSSANNATMISEQKQRADYAQNSQSIFVEQQKNTAPIDCNYKIPAETTKLEQAFIISWAEHAVMQSFNFSSNSLEEQLQKLQACYTENGWMEFKNALDKSGNIQTFKTQKLTSLSQMDGSVQINEAKENQWVLTLPVKVVYQFDTTNITQLMQVRLVIGRKITGDLGIMQLNSTLRQEVPAANLSHK